MWYGTKTCKMQFSTRNKFSYISHAEHCYCTFCESTLRKSKLLAVSRLQKYKPILKICGKRAGRE